MCRTVEVPNGKQKNHFDIEVGLRAKYCKELEKVLESQSACAVVTENLSDTARERVIKQLVDVSEVLRTPTDQSECSDNAISNALSA